MTATPADNLEIIGEEETDRQHKELLEKYDEFMRAVDTNIHRRDLLKMLDYLDSYTKTHFATEEKLLKDYGYPDFSSHAEEHRQFLGELWLVKSKLQTEGAMDEALRLTIHTLVRWLSQHIGATDKVAGDFIRKGRERSQ